MTGGRTSNTEERPAKQGLSLAQAAGVLRARRDGWALCIGAGTSTPAFPVWRALATALAHDELPDESIERLAEHMSPNALIQASQDRSGLGPRAFAEHLSALLYAQLRERVGSTRWRAVSRALNASSPGDLRLSTWSTFLDTVKAEFPRLTAEGIADAVLDSRAEVPPNAILSFNAEPLLYALINAKASLRSGRDPVHIPRVLDKQVRLLSGRRPGRIPYYFCHGLVGLPGTRRASVSAASPEHLVFAEASYLQLSNTSYSWQAAAFLSVCASSSILFVGTSLTDPNIRTWLSWIHAARVSELSSIGATQGPSTAHFWLTTHAPTAAEDRWIESSVAHLGVRVVWLDEWREAVPAMRSMLGL